VLTVRTEAGEHRITGTSEHPFYVPSRRAFVPMSELVAGDGLLAHNGGLAEVVRLDELPASGTVFNLEIEGSHTYLVCDPASDACELVHNACPALPSGPVAKALLDRVKIHLHHIFPQTFAAQFKQLGIDIHKYTVPISKGEHLKDVHGKGNAQVPGGWNHRWEEFFKQKQGMATPLEAYQFAGKLMDEYGLSGRPIVHY
jgi:hypothetical protein